jgi:hypothetical protein
MLDESEESRLVNGIKNVFTERMEMDSRQTQRDICNGILQVPRFAQLEAQRDTTSEAMGV